jgi:hypothetical protein
MTGIWIACIAVALLDSGVAQAGTNLITEEEAKLPHRKAPLRQTDAEFSGAALQADGETRSVVTASSIRRRSAAWIILPD